MPARRMMTAFPSASSKKSYWTSPGFTADLAHGSGTVLDIFAYLNDPTSKAYKAAGKYGKKAADFENAQLAAKGKEAFAIGQRAYLAEKQATDKALSRAVAVAAASGGGASDPGVMDIIGKLASEGNTNALSALYEGQSTQVAYQNEILANNYNADAAAAGYKFKGNAWGGANWDSAVGTLLSGIATFAEKYG
jgi:hypothetical protein